MKFISKCHFLINTNQWIILSLTQSTFESFLIIFFEASKPDCQDTDVVLTAIFCGMLHQQPRHLFGWGQLPNQLNSFLVLTNIPQTIAGNYHEWGVLIDLKLLDFWYVAQALILNL